MRLNMYKEQYIESRDKYFNYINIIRDCMEKKWSNICKKKVLEKKERGILSTLNKLKERKKEDMKKEDKRKKEDKSNKEDRKKEDKRNKEDRKKEEKKVEFSIRNSNDLDKKVLCSLVCGGLGDNKENKLEGVSNDVYVGEKLIDKNMCKLIEKLGDNKLNLIEKIGYNNIKEDNLRHLREKGLEYINKELKNCNKKIRKKLEKHISECNIDKILEKYKDEKSNELMIRKIIRDIN